MSEIIDMDSEQTEKEVEQTEPHDEITKLFLSPDGKYSQSVEQSAKKLVEQSEHESYQPKSFKLDCLKKIKEAEQPQAVSNNKLVAISRIGSSESSDYNKIYYVSDGLLWVQKVSKKQWIKYLRETLNENSKIRALPTKSEIVEILEEFKFKQESDFDRPYEGSLVMWKVSNRRVVQAFFFDLNKWEPIDQIELDVNFNYFYNARLNTEVKYYYKLLYNEDFVMITSFGLFIWSIWQKDKKIRLRYYIHWDEEILEDILENL
ncbi:32179_t:CDS:2 [Racocetra persica]|uniref:32179_t:CDS:1 n=1 Tax=Racocetra persica TaxID=160502 RepID=A0ACA9NRK8_9GLOM|nr:32179_t:CDS:2 [Racocetra persica]